MADIDPIIHPTNRLKICAFLASLDEAEFQLVRDELGVSDSVLSKQVSKLVDAGYVAYRKATVDGRQRTWLRMTDDGRLAFRRHVTALREIVALGLGD